MHHPRSKSFARLLATPLILGSFTLLVAACETALSPLLTEQSVTLVAPTNGLHTTDSSLLFTWEPLEEASGYQLQIAMPGFSNGYLLQSDTLTSRNQLRLKLPKGNYEWRVRGRNGAGYSLFSTPFQLTLQ